MDDPKKPVRKRGEHATSALNRQKILDATLKVAEEHGYLGTTIPRVSRKANLPTGSVYWHFESKDMLFAALMEQSREWLINFNHQRRPLPGEDARQHLTRIFQTPDNSLSNSAADFWRVGVILSIDQSVREQVSRARFLELRSSVIAEYTNWYRQTLPQAVQEADPTRAESIAAFQLICVDGNLILNSAGGKLDRYMEMVRTSLIALAEAPV